MTFYIDGKYMTNGTNADQYYLAEATEKYGVQSENIDLETAVGMYIDAWDEMVETGVWGSGIDLETGFNDDSGYYSAYSEDVTDAATAGYATPGFIVYNPDTYSVNIASTLSGITGFLPWRTRSGRSMRTSASWRKWTSPTRCGATNGASTPA